MGMGRRVRTRVCYLGRKTRCPWAFVLETDVGVVNLSGWMDGWMDGWIKWVEQDLDRVVGDADWILVLEMGVGRPWVGCPGIGDDFLGRT